MNDWDELYLEVILDHNKNPRNKDELDNFTHEAKGTTLFVEIIFQYSS